MLDKVFLGLPEGEEARKNYLESNSDAVEEISYTHLLTPEELNVIKEHICNRTSEIQHLEEEKKDITSDYNKRISTLVGDRKILLEKFDNKSERIKGDCYKVIDRDTKMVGYYDEDGILVHSRPMEKQEMQYTIFELNRTDTNN